MKTISAQTEIKMCETIPLIRKTIQETALRLGDTAQFPSRGEVSKY
jgi:hypothetical protein